MRSDRVGVDAGALEDEDDDDKDAAAVGSGSGCET